MPMKTGSRRKAHIPPSSRLTLTMAEAAATLGISRDAATMLPPATNCRRSVLDRGGSSRGLRSNDFSRLTVSRMIAKKMDDAAANDVAPAHPPDTDLEPVNSSSNSTSAVTASSPAETDAPTPPAGTANTAAGDAPGRIKIVKLLKGEKKPVARNWQLNPIDAESDDGRLLLERVVKGYVNYGIHAGASGLLIVDVDPKNGGDPEKYFADWPPTKTVRTPSGGYHFYYRWADSREMSGQCRPEPGVDFIVGMSQAVGPGSVVAGVSYKIIRDLPIADAPAFAIAQCLAAAEPKQKGANVLNNENAAEDGRNNALTSTMGIAVNMGLADAHVEAFALAINSRLQDPLPEDEVRSTVVTSAHRWVAKREDDTINVKTIGADAEAIVWDDAHPWPILDSAALYGLGSDFVRLIAPHSEADLSALIAQFFCAFGCAIGPSAHVMVEATPHTARLNVLLVGKTSGGRKGTAMGQVQRIFNLADPDFLQAAYVSGLASGEGLIGHLSDKTEREKVDGEWVENIIHTEKRALVGEPEFARLLAAASREGSTLGAVIRDLWDSGRLQNMTRKDPQVVEGAHACIIGHITADELRAKLQTTDIANGFLNRFNIVSTRRAQRLPHGGTITDDDLASLAARLRSALDFARQVGRVQRTDAANVAWEAFYNAVPEPEGLLGAVTARAEAQVLRLSLIYALLDESVVIDVQHLRAAIAFWNYSHASAQHVFGATLGDDVADRIVAELRAVYPSSMDRESVRGIFSRHITSARLTTAIDYLVRRKLATTESVKTDGRSREMLRAVHRAKSAISAESPPGADLSALFALSAQATECSNGQDAPSPPVAAPAVPDTRPDRVVPTRARRGDDIVDTSDWPEKTPRKTRR